MTEIRCKKCNRLLLRLGKKGGFVDAEIKCPKCKHLNKFWHEGEGVDLVNTKGFAVGIIR